MDKVELWSINNTENEKIKEELKHLIMINETNYITVGQSAKLFDYLGGDLYSFEKMVQKMKEKEKNEEIDKNKEENYNDNKNDINKNNKEDNEKQIDHEEENEEEEEEEQSLDEEEEFNY